MTQVKFLHELFPNSPEEVLTTYRSLYKALISFCPISYLFTGLLLQTDLLEAEGYLYLFHVSGIRFSINLKHSSTK